MSGSLSGLTMPFSFKPLCTKSVILSVFITLKVYFPPTEYCPYFLLALEYQSFIAAAASCMLSISGVNDRHAKMKYFVTHTEQINEDLARQEAEPPRGAVTVSIV